MRKLKVGVVLVAALGAQGCIPAGVFALVVAPSLANRPEVCVPCREEAARADLMAAEVPRWMEVSRAAAGPTVTTERTGYFSWQLSVEGQPIARCGARAGATWRCDSLIAPEDHVPL